MQVVRLWEHELRWYRLYRAGDTLLVHDPSGGWGCAARFFDLRSRKPLGPEFRTWETACLVDIPDRWPSPVLALVERQTLVISDVRDGTPLERIPLPKEVGDRSIDDMAIARVQGRDLLFLLKDDGGAGADVTSVTLDPAGPSVHWSDCVMLHDRDRDRIAFDEHWLAVPAEEWVYFPLDIVESPTVCVYRTGDGDVVGQIELWGGAELVIATVGGRSYLAQGDLVYSLPELAPVVEVRPSRVGAVALAEWEGRPVAVFAVEREDQPHVPGRDRPVRLFHCHLDDPWRPDGSGPALTEIPWEFDGEVYELLATPDREVVVAASDGVYLLTVDP